MIPKYYSYSAMQSFQKCPAQFQFRYIDRIFKKDEGIEAFMGKRVHETIENLYNQKKLLYNSETANNEETLYNKKTLFNKKNLYNKEIELLQ